MKRKQQLLHLTSRRCDLDKTSGKECWSSSILCVLYVAMLFLIQLERERMKNHRFKIVAIIPAYNEEGSIAKVILRARRYVDSVIVCDDGSTDMTPLIAEALLKCFNEMLNFVDAFHNAFWYDVCVFFVPRLLSTSFVVS